MRRELLLLEEMIDAAEQAHLVRQWVDELVPAVVDHGARGFIFCSADIDRAKAVARWAREIVPAVREAIAVKG